MTSTVDAFGRAHWLLRDRGRDSLPRYDALVVSVGSGAAPHETRLSAVTARFPHLDALPDGCFVVADARNRTPDAGQVQVFDATGCCARTFRLGDAIEHLLVDESGELWVGYFDEGTFGEDELSCPGLRRWSAAGEPLWAYTAVPGADFITDCYALNVSGTTGWSCAYTDFALVENRPGRASLARANPVRGAQGLAVHEGRVAFFGGYQDDHDRLVVCFLAGLEVRTVGTGRLTRPDGSPLRSGRQRIVGRGPRLYLQHAPWTDWSVFDLSVV
nr:hypothetical protein [Streptomyces sp. SID8379]